MADSIEAIVDDRLDTDNDLDDDAKLYVMAALDGTLDEVVEGGGEEGQTPRPPDTPETPAGAYLRRVSVAGFRGIGPRADLEVVPGPGLTLVVGANGTGKSSFAEGLEFLLTGRNSRWQDKSAEWRQGWRNLHLQDPPGLQASFAVDGKPDDALVSRRWRSVDVENIEDHTVEGLDALEWESALETHRPFLSYDQLSDIVEKGPSARFDAMAAGLGLERLTEARERLHARRVADQRAYSRAREQLVGLQVGLEQRAAEDERADAALAALEDEPWNLDAIPQLLEGVIDRLVIEQARRRRELKQPDAKFISSFKSLGKSLGLSENEIADLYLTIIAKDPDPKILAIRPDDTPDQLAEAGRYIALLRFFCTLEFVSPEVINSMVQKLHELHSRIKPFMGSSSLRSARLARAIWAAQIVHVHEGDQVCPVCETGRLDESWKRAADERVSRLVSEAKEVAQIENELERLTLECDELLWEHFLGNGLLLAAKSLGIDTSELAQAMQSWNSAITDKPSLESALGINREATEELTQNNVFADRLNRLTPSLTDEGVLEVAGRLVLRGARVRAALVPLRERAQVELDRREDLWRSLNRKLRKWLPVGRRGKESAERLAAVHEAESFLANVEEEVRVERFRPIEERARRYWGWMGQGSSITLDGLAVTEQAASRRLDLVTNIDDHGSVPLGIMSQGELNALSLSLFLARALLPESPFGFLVIDDPVQAMDPTKVEGLARVLAEAAQERQVIVFTHDERLPAAVRRLRIEHRLLAVTRRQNSQVQCQLVKEPVQRHLEDARAVLLTDPLDSETRRRVIPGSCRQALEAACVEAVWRIRTVAGRDYAETEQDVNHAQTLNDKLKLVLLDDVKGNHQDMRNALYQRFGARARDVVDACNRGAHGQWTGGMDALLDGTEWLAKRILTHGAR